ncbi:hypothetical protein Neosp_014554 [[Neocosmospora] mangrovei]
MSYMYSSGTGVHVWKHYPAWIFRAKLLDKIKSQEEQLKERAGSRSTADPSSELSPGNADIVSDAGSEQNQLDELPLSPGMNVLIGIAIVYL